MKDLDANLKTKIISHIKDNGPINLSSFMEMCLYDKQFGYYSNSNVIGKNGDFINFNPLSTIFKIQEIQDVLFSQLQPSMFQCCGWNLVTITRALVLLLQQKITAGKQYDPHMFTETCILFLCFQNIHIVGTRR